MKDKNDVDSGRGVGLPDDRRVDRRRFLGGAIGGFALAAGTPLSAAPRDTLAPGQRVPGAPFTNYGQPSPYERGVVRWIAANDAVPGNGISWTPLEQLDGSLTPNGLHFERHHNGIPDIDPATHRLRIAGAVTRPLEFDIDALLRYPRVSRTCFVECGGNSNAAWRRRPVQTTAGNFHGLVAASEWTGVPLGALLDEAGVAPAARWVIAEGADAFSLTMSIPLAKAREDCLLALYQNGERIRPAQGYPVRLLVPGW
ncbi:MAG: molybdopterin-dependent oxidoreductase, partial [Gammaproteobacteria bacterium]